MTGATVAERYEYTFLEVGSATLDLDMLNKVGGDGWQVVVADSTGKTWRLVLMRRQAPAEQGHPLLAALRNLRAALKEGNLK